MISIDKLKGTKAELTQHDMEQFEHPIVHAISDHLDHACISIDLYPMHEQIVISDQKSEVKVMTSGTVNEWIATWDRDEGGTPGWLNFFQQDENNEQLWIGFTPYNPQHIDRYGKLNSHFFTNMLERAVAREINKIPNKKTGKIIEKIINNEVIIDYAMVQSFIIRFTEHIEEFLYLSIQKYKNDATEDIRPGSGHIFLQIISYVFREVTINIALKTGYDYIDHIKDEYGEAIHLD